MNIIFQLFFFVAISTSVFAQDFVKSFNVTIPKKSDVFQIIEEDKKQVILFFCSDKKIIGTRLDENFEVIDSISTIQVDKKFDKVLGYSLSNGKYHTYWTNGKAYMSKTFDFETKTVVNKTYDVSIDKEKVINTLSINNVFYLVTVGKDSNILNFYIFNDGNYVKKVADFSSKMFFNRSDKEASLASVLSEGNILEAPYSIQNISNDSPASLVFTASKRKCYTYGNRFIVTIDNNKIFTQYLAVDLTNFTVDYKIFGQPEIVESAQLSEESNSFLLEKNLIQIHLNSDNLKIAVKDMDNKTIKSFKANSKEEITFKNSNIIQENSNAKNTKTIEKTSKFIRNIYNLNPSLSCYIHNDNYYLTIGSISEPQSDKNNAYMYAGMFGGLTGALIAIALTSSYSSNNLNSYNDRVVVYLNSVLDQNFNHVPGEIKKLAFDKLRIYSAEHKGLQYTTVFKSNKTLYFGAYTNVNTYSIYSFKD